MNRVAKSLGLKGLKGEELKRSFITYQITLWSTDPKRAVIITVRIWKGRTFAVVLDMPGVFMVVSTVKELRGAATHMMRLQRKRDGGTRHHFRESTMVH